MQIHLTGADGDQRIYHRGTDAVRRSLDRMTLTTDSGLPFIAPEVALLYKSPTLRLKDMQDFADVPRHFTSRRQQASQDPTALARFPQRASQVTHRHRQQFRRRKHSVPIQNSGTRPDDRRLGEPRATTRAGTAVWTARRGGPAPARPTLHAAHGSTAPWLTHNRQRSPTATSRSWKS